MGRVSYMEKYFPVKWSRNFLYEADWVGKSCKLEWIYCFEIGKLFLKVWVQFSTLFIV